MNKGVVNSTNKIAALPTSLSDTLKVVGATIATTVVALTLLWQLNHHFATPIYDDIFDRLRMYRALHHATLLLRYFASLHNEHRILTTRLFAFVDEFAFSGREYTQVFTTNVLQIVSAVVIYRFIFLPEMGKAWGPADRFFALATLLLLFINPNLLYTLVVPFQLQHAIMAFLSIIGAWVVSQGPWPPGRKEPDLRYLIPRLLGLAVIATFTLGNAPAILIGAAVTAFVLRWSLRTNLLLGGLAAAHTIIVLATTPATGTPSYEPIKILKFTLIYLGSPFLRIDPWPSGYVTWGTSIPLAGIVGSMVAGTALLFSVLLYFREGFGGRTAVFGFMLLVIVIVTGVAAGHSRVQFGIMEAANKKYASFAALGWVGMGAAFAGAARGRLTFVRRPEVGVLALLLVLLLPLSVLGYQREPRVWQKEIDRISEAGLALVLQINDRPKLHDLYTDEAGLAQYRQYVAGKRRGIFAHFRFQWGDDAKQFLSKSRNANCQAEVETMTPIPTADLTTLFDVPGTPVSVSGWAWMSKDHAPRERFS